MDFSDFQPALFAATVMNAFEPPWCIAGGWAIDLWLGRLTRNHADVEVAIFREDQITLRDFLHDWTFRAIAADGTPRVLRDRQLLMLPVHELQARNRQGREIEFLLNECDTVDWIYRRDARIRWPRDAWTVRGAFGVPVLVPHLVLLYKSKSPRPQDELDFRTAVPELAPELRRWLAEALRLANVHHPWLQQLI